MCDIFNYSTIINTSGSYYWRSYANNTYNRQNVTDTWIFNVTTLPITTTTIPIPPDFCRLIWIEENAISKNDFCIDNDTLRHNLTYDIDGTISYALTYENCNFGCDNKTHSCYPNPTRQNLFMLPLLLKINDLPRLLERHSGMYFVCHGRLLTPKIFHPKGNQESISLSVHLFWQHIPSRR